MKMKVVAEASDGREFVGTDAEALKAEVERYEAGLKEAGSAQVNRAIKAYMEREGLTGDKTAKRLADFTVFWMSEGRYIPAASRKRKGGEEGGDES